MSCSKGTNDFPNEKTTLYVLYQSIVTHPVFVEVYCGFISYTCKRCDNSFHDI